MGTSPSNINFGGDLVRIPQWASVAEAGGKEGRLQPLYNGSAAVLDDNCYRTTSPAFAASTRKSEGPGRARGRPRFDIIAAEIPHSSISTGLLRVSPPFQRTSHFYSSRKSSSEAPPRRRGRGFSSVCPLRARRHTTFRGSGLQGYAGGRASGTGGSWV